VVAAFVESAPIVYRSGKIVSDTRNSPLTQGTRLRSASDDGKLLVGNQGLTYPKVAVVWQEKEGFQTLVDFMAEKKVKPKEGWTPLMALYVSPDGSTIIGSARNAQGNVRPFRLTLAP
jgi:hypothetical protein